MGTGPGGRLGTLPHPPAASAFFRSGFGPAANEPRAFPLPEPRSRVTAQEALRRRASPREPVEHPSAAGRSSPPQSLRPRSSAAPPPAAGSVRGSLAHRLAPAPRRDGRRVLPSRPSHPVSADLTHPPGGRPADLPGSAGARLLPWPVCVLHGYSSVNAQRLSLERTQALLS